MGESTCNLIELNREVCCQFGQIIISFHCLKMKLIRYVLGGHLNLDNDKHFCLSNGFPPQITSIV